MDITRDTIDKILSMARPELVMVDDRTYSTLGLTAVAEPSPAALPVVTLTALVEYVKKNFDTVDSPIIHIENHGAVRLISKVFGPFCQRAVYLKAENANKTEFRFGQYYDAESFIVNLQSQFEDWGSRAAILALLGNVKEEGVQTWGDDGITQSVTAKKGIALVQNVPVPNPVASPFPHFSRNRTTRVALHPACSVG